MKYLDKFLEDNLVFWDIETVAGEKKLTKKSPLYDAWLYKHRHQNEVLKKGGEEMTPEAHFAEKAALYGPFAKIVVIVAGRIVDGNKLRVKAYYGEEGQLLTDFNNDLAIIHEANPMTSMVGWMSDGFDGPMTAKRSIVNGVAPHSCLDVGDAKPWELQSIDLGKLWKGNSYYPDSLAAVAAALGLPSPKVLMEGSQVTEEYYKGNVEGIINYCIGDVLTEANIYRKFQGKSILTLAS